MAMRGSFECMVSLLVAATNGRHWDRHAAANRGPDGVAGETSVFAAHPTVDLI
jgi:hypothetical protein